MPPAPTEIQTPDLRLDPVPVIELATPPPQKAIKKPATDLPTTRQARPADDVVGNSAAFRREMERFAKDQLPDLEDIGARPLAEDIPAEADALGRPLAAIDFKGERKEVGLVLITCLVCGFLAMCICPVISKERLGWDEILAVWSVWILTAAPFVGIGAWLAFFRKWTPHRTLWVCPRGLIWQWGARVGFKRWHEIEDFSASGATGRPLFWVTPAEGVDFVISAGQGPAIVPIADYIELKSAAALLPIFLRLLLAGEKVRFDRLSMEPIGIRARGQVCLWSEIGGTRLDGTAFLITDRDRQELVRLRTRDVSFPMVAQAIVRIVTEEGLLK